METVDVERRLSHDVGSENEILARIRESREILGESRKSRYRRKTFRVVPSPKKHFGIDFFELIEISLHGVSDFLSIPFVLSDSILEITYENADGTQIFFVTRGDVRIEEYGIGYGNFRSVSGNERREPRESAANVEDVLADESVLSRIYGREAHFRKH